MDEIQPKRWKMEMILSCLVFVLFPLLLVSWKEFSDWFGYKRCCWKMDKDLRYYKEWSKNYRS